MNWYRLAANNDFEDMFGPDDGYKPPKVIRRDPPTKVPVTLTLYHGTKVNPETLPRRGQAFILDPAHSEQGVLWFTCPMIQQGALQTAQGHGDWLITYQLQAIRHVETSYFDDNSPPRQETPEYFHQHIAPAENGRFWMGYELPEGWQFSYKVQKYIICQNQIEVMPNQIKPIRRDQEGTVIE